MINVVCGHCGVQILTFDVVRNPSEVIENLRRHNIFKCSGCGTIFSFRKMSFAVHCSNRGGNRIHVTGNNTRQYNSVHSLVQQNSNVNICPDCGGQVVFDHINMMFICTNCGLVFEDKTVYSPERYKENVLPRTSGIVSSIYPNYGVGSITTHNDKVERAIKYVLDNISDYPMFVKESCCRLLRLYFSKINGNNTFENEFTTDNNDDQVKTIRKLPEKKIRRLMIASLYLVLRRRGLIQSISELTDKYDVVPKEIFRGVKEIMRVLTENDVSRIVGQRVRPPTIVEFIRLICSKINLQNINVILDYSEKLYNILSSSHPELLISQSQIVASAIVYLSTQLLNYDPKRVIEELSYQFNVRPQSIRQYANKIVKFLDINYYIQ